MTHLSFGGSNHISETAEASLQILNTGRLRQVLTLQCHTTLP